MAFYAVNRLKMFKNTLNDTYQGVMINRTKFDVCMPSSFGGVEAHILTYVDL